MHGRDRRFAHLRASWLERAAISQSCMPLSRAEANLRATPARSAATSCSKGMPSRCNGQASAVSLPTAATADQAAATLIVRVRD